MFTPLRSHNLQRGKPLLSYAIFAPAVVIQEGVYGPTRFDRIGSDGQIEHQFNFYERYLAPLKANILSYRERLPHWQLRVYVAADAADLLMPHLHACPLGLWEAVIMPPAQYAGMTGMFWRLLPAGDVAVPRFFCCDADEELPEHVKVDLARWEQRSEPFMGTIQAPSHPSGLTMCGCRWGAVSGACADLEDKIVRFHADMAMWHGERHPFDFHVPGHYGFDEYFLHHVVWPIAQEKGYFQP